MDLSPPPLSRSPVSSPNTDYPSPDMVEDHYKLSSLYDQSCVMEHSMGPESLSLDTTSSAEWSAPLSQTTTSSYIPSILAASYNAFGSYDASIPPTYPHDIYANEHTHTHPGSLSPQPFSRTLSQSPDPPRPTFAYRLSGSPPPQVKMESGSEYPELEYSRYPSPHLGPAIPVEIGGYSSAASSSGYLSDAPSGSWPKSEYATLEHDAIASSSAAPAPSLIQDRQPYRIHRAPRSRPRRLTTKEEANYQCEVKGCGKLFSRSYNYKAHLETHDENREYPFPCTANGCSKKFVRKTDLQRHHQSVHMKEKNHRCDYCNRMFARKDTLRRHMEDGCSKRFDIGTLDVRSEAMNFPVGSRSTSNLLTPPTQLPPMTSSRPRHINPNILEPAVTLMRRGY